MLEEFGYVQKGPRWLMKRPVTLTLCLTVFGLVLLCVGVSGVSTASYDLSRKVTAGWAFGVGAFMLLWAWYTRTYIDLAARAFVRQTPFGRRRLAFTDMAKLRLVEHFINSSFQGFYYEVASKPAARPRVFIRISNHFAQETPSFVAAVAQAMNG